MNASASSNILFLDQSSVESNVVHFPTQVEQSLCAPGVVQGRAPEEDDPDFIESCLVYPIKEDEAIAMFQRYFFKEGKKWTDVRNYVLFTIGINVGLRCGDLVRLQARHFIDEAGNVRDSVKIREEKTDKVRTLHFNAVVQSVAASWIAQRKLSGKDYLFASRKKADPHLQVDSVGNLIRKAGRELDYSLPVSSHSMRKTWAYKAYMANLDNPYALTILQRALGHSSPLITMRYLGIEDKEVRCLYTEVVRGEVLM